ncbi:hypothetical protein CORC01_08379 [Colletotrichum orchidophilum]|uniref:Uncharacterized protein n=1 Tax=Colletotrichum orchidophilum TaxID=1209926 RepID=A0A1G4B4I1_9PEZI|nr:uncharacterized protein CORC01_08379 [Colletotrichum orchidophilum]OHE96307.1 hypothetical protein CORC01_08379 [Colletotrichum orchidophilum]
MRREEGSQIRMAEMGSREWLARLDDWRWCQKGSVGDSAEKAGRDIKCHTGGRSVVASHVPCCARRYPAAKLCRPGALPSCLPVCRLCCSVNYRNRNENLGDVDTDGHLGCCRFPSRWCHVC